ncbi:MAG TPA: DUF1499 domain-containing protein [Nitrospirota bacterium]|nr:DUF1499 domain-containing protein [Nitrospirota bacterium]
MMNSARATVSVLGLAASLFLLGCSGALPANLGVRDGWLAPCPETPNCVSSQSTDREHAIEPLSYSTSKGEALADLKKIIGQMKRARIIEERDGYIHAEFTSAIWRFVDDVEFFVDESAHVIQVRSASRLGKSDFGVNRKRIEAIRAAWKAGEK